MNNVDASITMIDYGGSNLRSVQKAFEYVGATVTISADPDAVQQASKLVLPGVGAFGAGMAALEARGLAAAIRAAVERGIPLLGICLGMQFLFDASDEMGHHTGLGLIPGQVRQFPTAVLRAQGLKIPHMGWNQIEPAGNSSLLTGVPAGAHTYFVHSYYCDPADATVVLAWTDYGFPFPAIVARANIYGIQFHPEKSQQTGQRILRNFANL